jgi:hypothetical protein
MCIKIYSLDGFLNTLAIGNLATKKEFEKADTTKVSIFEELKPGATILLKEGSFVLNEDLDPEAT